MARVLVAGGAGFIGSHLARRLKNEGHEVYVADWKEPEFMGIGEFCDKFAQLDLREDLLARTAYEFARPDWVFQLAADMGGMGFISKNNALIGYNNAMINLNMLKWADVFNVQRYLFTSSACIYPVNIQDQNECRGLAEADAYPALPQKVYGWEKLYTEQVVQAYQEDNGLNTHIVRFHNIYGPQGTWTGGREKAPAAFSRKVAEAKFSGLSEIEMWGDGEQTRTFLYIDDCVDAILRVMATDYHGPVNIGAEDPVSMNELMDIVCHIAGCYPEVKHIDGPVGVRGRNCDGTLLKQLTGWEQGWDLRSGMEETYSWIEKQVAKQ